MENNNNKEKLEEDIMSKIRSGKVKLRSRYIFLAEKLGIESIFILSAIFAVLFVNLFFFYLKATDNLAYLSFGSEGIYAFLESFPYQLVIAFIIFIFIAGYFLAKTDYSYRKPFKYFALYLIAFVFASGAVLAYTDVPERLEEQAFGDQPMGAILNPFFKKGIESRNSGVAGQIYEIDKGYLMLFTVHGDQKVSLEDINPDLISELRKDYFILAVGKRKNDVFVAKKIRVMDQNMMPMIRRRIRIHININPGGAFIFPEHYLIQGKHVYIWM